MMTWWDDGDFEDDPYAEPEWLAEIGELIDSADWGKECPQDVLDYEELEGYLNDAPLGRDDANS